MSLSHQSYVRGATQKFGEFKQGAWTGCRMPFRCLMWLAVWFVNLCDNSCQAERTCYWVQCVFERLCFSDKVKFFTTDMTDFKEQRICIKFCFNLKKLLQKPTECYRMPLEVMPWAKAKLFYGRNTSRTDECLLTTMSVLDDRRQAQHRKT
jgi:hypothetical protein